MVCTPAQFVQHAIRKSYINAYAYGMSGLVPCWLYAYALILTEVMNAE